jgi:Domain of unknown function (DUF4124)
MRKVITFFLLTLLSATVAEAQIYQWRDSSGARHFTNKAEGIPESARGTSTVFVPQGVIVTEEAPQKEPTSTAPGSAQVVYDMAGLRRIYEQGFEDGLGVAGRGGDVRVDSGLHIQGPLAIASAESSQPAFVPLEYPLVTTSFDRGRSRHLTLRMLLQDQFQLDRDGPFLYQRMNPIGMGPALSPFLPRGLPHGFSVGQRVLFR